MAERKRLLIVGGVAGGASAAARARRLDDNAEIILFERGEHISFANCGLPYHIGGAIPQRDRLLVQTPEAMRRRFRIDVRTRTEVTRIDREHKQLFARDLRTGQEKAEPYDALILSPGAEPVRPPIPGIDSPLVFTLRSLGDMDAIKKAVEDRRPSRAAVIGGGYIGLEMAEALRQRGLEVAMIELTNQVFGPIDPEMAEPLHQHLKLHGVDLRLGTSVTAVRQAGDQLDIQLSDGSTISCGLAVLSVGVRPEVKLARQAGLKVGQRGGIVVDEHMQTSDPNIYAVGDAVEVTDFVGGHQAVVPLAGPANRQGRIAADNVFGRPSIYHRTQGTAICKVFDLAVGMTGLSEKMLKQMKAPYEKVYVHPASHASYYPGASPISLKLLFDPQDGRVLGAQAVGASGVDKRIDVIAVAIRAKMTVFDLEELELSYAPPYGSAKDPVNYAGFVAANVLRGDVKLVHSGEVIAPREDQMILDVRMPQEVQAGTIPGSVNIPLDELRDRLGELPREKELLVACQVGLRGYLACRILEQHGFRARNLTGGYKTYSAYAASKATRTPPPPATPRGEMKDDTGGGSCGRAAPAVKKSGNDGGCCEPASGSGTGVPPVRGMGVSPMQSDPQPDAAGTAATRATAVVKQIDATALQCPGPIMRLSTELAAMQAGQAVAVLAADPAFGTDVQAWCNSTGNRLLRLEPQNGNTLATVARGEPRPQAAAAAATDAARNKTIVVFSGDLDKVLGSFIIANGAAAMGSKVTMFFTFWGLNALRRPQKVAVNKTLIERMFGWMMPRGAGRLKLSKMNMGGMGTWMMKGVMRKKNVASLEQLIDSARAAGVRLVACSMSMDVMGIRREELIDGVDIGGVAAYLDTAEQGNVNLFI